MEENKDGSFDITNITVEETDETRLNQLSEQAEWISKFEAQLTNEYVVMHIKLKPKWLPNFIYRWILSKVLVITSFHKIKNIVE